MCCSVPIARDKRRPTLIIVPTPVMSFHCHVRRMREPGKGWRGRVKDSEHGWKLKWRIICSVHEQARVKGLYDEK